MKLFANAKKNSKFLLNTILSTNAFLNEEALKSTMHRGRALTQRIKRTTDGCQIRSENITGVGRLNIPSASAHFGVRVPSRGEVDKYSRARWGV